MNRRTISTLTRAAGALLLERLLARARHFRAGLRLVRSLAETGEVVAHCLVNEMLLVRVPEDRFRQVERAHLLVVPVPDINGRHGYSLFFPFPFLEKRTKTRPLRPPGTAPLM